MKVPKLRKTSFETAIIERYRRREASVEEALIEMYLAGVSVRRVEDVTEALWGTRVSPGTVSELNKKIYERIELWRNRPVAESYPYLYLDGLYLKRNWGGEVHNVAILVAVGVDREAALSKAEAVARKFELMKLSKAAEVVRRGAADTLSYYYFPREHWLRIRTNNMLERIMREIRRRTRVVGCFPDGNSALMLSAASVVRHK